MNFLKEMRVIIATTAVAWISCINNNTLSIIVNLLTILILSIGLIDWTIRKIKGRAKKKQKERRVFDLIESSQKPFKTVNMLDDPMAASEAIGNIIEQTTIGGKKMKKVFKWIWYNKEQLLSIVYHIAILALVNILLFTDAFNALMTVYLGVHLPLWVKLIAVGLALVFTILTVRNVVVTYGLSSLETIDNVLKEKALIKASKLSPEQKQVYKEYISTLNNTLVKAKKELKVIEEEFTKLTVLYNADNSLVPDYTSKTVAYQKKIAADKQNISNLENKLAQFKALLSGQITSK